MMGKIDKIVFSGELVHGTEIRVGCRDGAFWADATDDDWETKVCFSEEELLELLSIIRDLKKARE